MDIWRKARQMEGESIIMKTSVGLESFGLYIFAFFSYLHIFLSRIKDRYLDISKLNH